MSRKRRSLLGAPAAPISPAATTAEAATPSPGAVAEPAPSVPDRSPVANATPAGSFPTPPTRDRASDAWFLASGQSPPERTATEQEPPVVVPVTRNPWLSAAPLAGVGAVGLLFVLVLAVALAMFG